jgi:hypothetical protein
MSKENEVLSGRINYSAGPKMPEGCIFMGLHDSTQSGTVSVRMENGVLFINNRRVELYQDEEMKARKIHGRQLRHWIVSKGLDPLSIMDRDFLLKHKEFIPKSWERECGWSGGCSINFVDQIFTTAERLEDFAPALHWTEHVWKAGRAWLEVGPGAGSFVAHLVR